MQPRTRSAVLYTMISAIVLAVLTLVLTAPAQTSSHVGTPGGTSATPAATIKLSPEEALAIRDLQFKISQTQMQTSAIWQEFLLTEQGQQYIRGQRQVAVLQKQLGEVADKTWKAHGVSQNDYLLDQDSWTLVKKQGPSDHGKV